MVFERRAWRVQKTSRLCGDVCFRKDKQEEKTIVRNIIGMPHKMTGVKMICENVETIQRLYCQRTFSTSIHARPHCALAKPTSVSERKTSLQAMIIHFLPSI